MGFFRSLGKIGGGILGGLVGGPVGALTGYKAASSLGRRAGGTYSNPYYAAQTFLSQLKPLEDKYLDDLFKQFNPSIQAGNQATALTTPIYGEMAQSPSAFLEKIMSNYNPSKGYQFKKNEIGNLISNNAAAAGNAGGSFSQKQQADFLSMLLDEDMQKYINNTLGIQNTGLSGLGGVSAAGNASNAMLAQGRQGSLLRQSDALQSLAGNATYGQQYNNMLAAQQRAKRDALLADLFGMLQNGGNNNMFGNLLNMRGS
jgi:hypothetical protein